MAESMDDDWNCSSLIRSSSSSLPQSIEEALETVIVDSTTPIRVAMHQKPSSSVEAVNKNKKLGDSKDKEDQEEVGKCLLVTNDEGFNGHSHCAVEVAGMLNPVHNTQRQNMENVVQREVFCNVRKEQLSLTTILADSGFNEAAHWINIKSPATTMRPGNVESTTENSLSNILKPQIVPSVNSENGKTMGLLEVGTQMSVRQEMVCIDLTGSDDPGSDVHVVQAKVDKIIPKHKKLKMNVNNVRGVGAHMKKRVETKFVPYNDLRRKSSPDANTQKNYNDLCQANGNSDKAPVKPIGSINYPQTNSKQEIEPIDLTDDPGSDVHVVQPKVDEIVPKRQKIDVNNIRRARMKERVKIKCVSYCDLRRKPPPERDAILDPTKTSDNSLAVPKDSIHFNLRQQIEGVNLTHYPKSAQHLGVDQMHDETPKINVHNVLESKVTEEGTQVDLDFVDLTDNLDSSENYPLKLEEACFEVEQGHKDDILPDLEKGDRYISHDRFRNELSAVESYRTGNDESIGYNKYHQNWVSPTMDESSGCKDNKESQDYDYDCENEELGDDCSEIKKTFIHYDEFLSDNVNHGPIISEIRSIDDCQKPKLSPGTVWRKELLSTDFNLMYGNLRAILMKNMSKSDRHLSIQTMIATMGEIEEVTMGGGNPVQQSVRCEAPESDMSYEKSDYKDGTSSGSNVEIKAEPASLLNFDKLAVIEDIGSYWEEERLINLVRTQNLIKTHSGGVLSCQVCGKIVDSKLSRCKGCYAFKYRMDCDIAKKIPLPTCSHKNYSRSPKCRSCRYMKYCFLSMDASNFLVNLEDFKECPVCRKPSLLFRGWRCSKCHYFVMKLLHEKASMPTCKHGEEFSSNCDGCLCHNLKVEWARNELVRPFPLS